MASLPPEFAVPWPSMLDVDYADDAVMKVARPLEDNLQALKIQADRFSADVVLFAVCRRQPQETLSEWTFVAGRDGAMALRNYRQALSVVRGLIGRSPPIAEGTDAEALKMIAANFDAKFPRVDKLRHAVAHPEFYANPEIDMSSSTPVKTASIKAEGPGLTIQEGFDGDVFLATINGLFVNYPLNHDAALFVVQSTRDVFRAFTKLDRTLRMRARLQQRRPD